MLAEAAALLGSCANFWRDESDHLSKGMRIHYAVDVDVVLMYCDPETTTKQNRGRIFSQADDVSELVNSLVGDFILQRFVWPVAMTANANAVTTEPLVLIPPHDEELKRVVLSISKKVAATTNSDVRQIGAAKSGLLKRLEDRQGESVDEAFLSFLSEHAPQLHNLLLGLSGPAATMARLNMLPPRRLVAMEKHLAFLGDASLKLPPSREALGGDASKMKDFATDWYRLMASSPEQKLHLKQETSGFRREGIDDDARVLATLQWVNEDAACRSINRRLVLITLTDRIHEAGKQRAASHEGYDSFAAAYLRDPRAWMGSKSFFAPHGEVGNETRFSLLDWMATLFPNSIHQSRSQLTTGDGSTVTVNAEMPDLRSVIHGDAFDSALRVLLSNRYRSIQEKSFPESALDEWRKVVRDTHTQAVLDSQHKARSKRLRELLDAMPRTDEGRFQHLMDGLAKQVQNSFSNLYLATGVIGVEQVLDEASNIKGLPALRFGAQFEQARRICDSLTDDLFEKKRQGKPFDVGEMYSALAKEDDSNYHAHVLHAFVYASAGRWFSVRALCRVALLVVDALPGELAGRRTGREAAYLLAVAERRLADSRTRLKHARDALANARKRAGERQASDIRFESEAFAQNVTERQLEHFRDVPANPVDPTTDLREAHRICDLITSAQEPPAVRCWVLRQAVTNGLLSALIALDGGMPLSDEAQQLARKLVSVLELEHLSPKLSWSDEVRRYRDGISDFVWLVAVASFEPNALKTEAQKMLAGLTPPPKEENIRFLEPRRFQRFLRLVGVANNSG